MDGTTQFGVWLREKRRALDLTQLELAEKVGCSDSAIRLIEAGQRRPSRQVAALLAEHLGIPTHERNRFLSWAREPHGSDGHSAELIPQAEGSGEVPTNLKEEPTRFIGRDEEIAAIERLLLHGSMRLLTLTGPPGVGKTRLALAVAAKILHSQPTAGVGPYPSPQDAPPRDFRDGVFFVGLAAISDPDLVAAGIAHGIGLRESTTTPFELLKGHLKSKRLLLVLDNFEHVLEAASLISGLVPESPGVCWLVTSREPLHVRGEQQFEVPSMPRPGGETLPVEEMLQYPAVALFVERAQAVDARFRLSEENAPAVATLCEAVDGLPLAIELVAARVKLLPPAALAQRFGPGHGGASLPLLSGGHRDLPERHRTLRGAIGWSYDLLNNDERALFARLGVFAGGYTLPSVEAVCNARGDLDMSVLDGLASLLDKSLVKRDDTWGDEPRYSMLATIREYSAARLEESGEAERVRGWCLEYYLALAQAARPHLLSADQRTWLAMLDAEQANVRAALRWAIDRGRIEVAARIAVALLAYWYVRGNISEGRAWLEEIARREEMHSLPVSLQAEVTGAAGALASAQCDLEPAIRLLDTSLALSRQAQDKEMTSDTLRNLGTAEILRGDYARAESLLREVLSLSKELGQHRRGAIALHNLAWVAFFTGDYGQAQALEAEAAPLFQEVGDKWHAGLARALWGLALCREGQPNQAEIMANQVITELQGLEGNNLTLGLAITCLAEVARHRGDNATARQLYRKSLREEGDTGSFAPKVLNLMGLGSLAAMEGDAERATVLFGALDGLASRLKARVIAPSAAPEYERGLAAAKASIHEAQWAAAWSRSRAMSLDEAVAFALAEAGPI
ncbi:MAG TPA: tetratricopeptide repeat protein [Chloroflexia bacterium]|jgi:predicted ATPase/DNA-binding XRE family transcriptional regulator